MAWDAERDTRPSRNYTTAQNKAARQHWASQIMDPFSVALGGIILCQVAIQFGFAYDRAVHTVPEDVRLLVSEITLMSGVFTALCSSLEAQKEETRAVTSGLKDTADECKAKLEELYAFLVK